MLSDSAKKRLLEYLYAEEDYKQFAYDDATGEVVKAPKGYLTIGIGWNIQVNGCPKEIAQYAALYFINKADLELSQRLPIYNSLDDVRKVVLCDMSFNMGVDGVLQFHNMLFALKTGDFAKAANAMVDSKWASQVGSRAEKLKKMLGLGLWI